MGDRNSQRSAGHRAVVKILILYSVAGSAIAVVAEVAGVGIGYVLLASFAGPPFLHLLFLLGRFKGYY
jgi:hypothetical protein